MKGLKLVKVAAVKAPGFGDRRKAICVTAPDFLPFNFFFFAIFSIHKANGCIDTAPFFVMLV
ncbi:hypothetical protein GQR86_07115 [Providencia vermicola]|nr:hypothetical protein [Providencia sp. G1(2023)]MBC8653077.1 hypothetical protein [Providencia vermicola]